MNAKASKKEKEALQQAQDELKDGQVEQVDEVEMKLEAAQQEAADHKEKTLRVLAEFENFKKRMSRDVADQGKYANEKLLSELLPTLDNLDRVIDHVTPKASDEVKKIVDGVELVRKELLATLARFELKEVEAQGQVFDPNQHEAISVVESETAEPDTVLAIHRKGYWLDERLLRPALVTVVKSDAS